MAIKFRFGSGGMKLRHLFKQNGTSPSNSFNTLDSFKILGFKEMIVNIINPQSSSSTHRVKFQFGDILIEAVDVWNMQPIITFYQNEINKWAVNLNTDKFIIVITDLGDRFEFNIDYRDNLKFTILKTVGIDYTNAKQRLYLYNDGFSCLGIYY